MRQDERMYYPLEVLLKVAAAVVMGGAVGWQREARDRPAGLRTHVLVCVGSAVYTLASLSFTGPTSDPGRVAAQVAAGMGFLGAGTIIRYGTTVRGLTTAASMWAVAGIGVCVGIGGETYWVAAIATLVVLLTLTVLRSAELRLVSRPRHAHIIARLAGARQRVAEIQRTLSEAGVELDSLQLLETAPGGVEEIEIGVLLPSGSEISRVSAELARVEGFISLRSE